MRSGNASEVYIEIGDVIDLANAEVTESTRFKRSDLFIRIASQNGKNYVHCYAPVECRNYLRGKVTRINRVWKYPTGKNGRFYVNMNVYIDLEPTDEEPTLYSAANINGHIAVMTEEERKEKGIAPEFTYGSVKNGAEKES